MSVELIGGPLLSALLETLFERMASREVSSFFRAKKLDEAKLKKLKSLLLSANLVLDSAEDMQIRSPGVKNWLGELTDASNELEDLLDEIRTEALFGEPRRRLVTSLLSPSFASEVNPRISEIMDRLGFILSQKDSLGLRQGGEPSRPSCRSLPCPLVVEERDVYGRGCDKEEVVRLLLSESSGGNVGVISVVGMGGIGKTTLAQLVFKDCRVRRHFHVKAWVSVSDNFDALNITKSLLEKVAALSGSVEHSDSDDTTSGIDLRQLQVRLKRALRNRRFLFVLDDVWNENNDDWDVLKSPFESGARGSRIIATTRSETAASKMSSDTAIYRLRTISSQDCWLLFAKHAFGDADSASPVDLAEIGKQIVKKCNDLPLAVKSLGGLLRVELSPCKWRNILQSDIWDFSDRESNILPALWLSYHHLPSHLKRCFAYCSVFPRDREISKRTLVLLWMAQDLLQPREGKKTEDVGEECFDSLVARSLIERDGSSFVMHGLVNDLAKFVSGKFCLRLEHDCRGIGSNGAGVGSGSVHHFTYDKRNIAGAMEVLASVRLGCLRTFLPLRSPGAGSETPEWNTSILDKLADSARHLRVLSFSQYPIAHLPKSIRHLKQLRYLNLSSTLLGVIPDEVTTLCNLQTLLLLGCRNLTRLPAYMGSLVNLRHLDTRGTKIEEMPSGMCHMKDLQTLSNVALGKHSASNIKELRDLKQLSGGFTTSGIENIADPRDAFEANLKDKQHLTELGLQWHGVADDSQKEKETLGGLQPHTNLENLYVHGYQGTRFPDWIGHVSFSNMVSLSLLNCTNCCLLPPLGLLPSLQKLQIVRFSMVRSVGAEFYSDVASLSIPFRSLERLVFRHMPEWREWSFPRVTGDDGYFPRLTELCLEFCPNLTGGLPERTIETIVITGCAKLNFPP